jgi:hypothetical protein
LQQQLQGYTPLPSQAFTDKYATIIDLPERRIKDEPFPSVKRTGSKKEKFPEL